MAPEPSRGREPARRPLVVDRAQRPPAPPVSHREARSPTDPGFREPPRPAARPRLDAQRQDDIPLVHRPLPPPHPPPAVPPPPRAPAPPARIEREAPHQPAPNGAPATPPPGAGRGGDRGSMGGPDRPVAPPPPPRWTRRGADRLPSEPRPLRARRRRDEPRQQRE